MRGIGSFFFRKIYEVVFHYRKDYNDDRKYWILCAKHF